MLLPLLLLIAQAPASVAEPPLAELVEDPAPATTPAVTSTATTTTTTAPAVRPWVFGLELGLDVPVAQRLPMAATRVSGGLRVELPANVVGGAGLRSGYSYVAGQGPAADPALGVDDVAFLMAHRIPVRGEGRLGLFADDGPLDGPVEIGVVASAGADVVVLQANSFGRKASATLLAPGLSLGGYLSFSLGDSVGLGLIGEWDSAAVDLRSAAPGVIGDLSAVRLALALSFAFGT